MRQALSILLVLGVSPALAFDADAWLEKRALLEREATRLREAYSNCAARVQTPAESVDVPIETHPDGSVKTRIHADRAMYFLDTGFVWGHGVTVVKYDRSGAVDATIRAASCVVDRYTRSGWAEGSAEVVRGDAVMRGENVYFSSPEEFVTVYRACDLRADELKFGGAK